MNQQPKKRGRKRKHSPTETDEAQSTLQITPNIESVSMESRSAIDTTYNSEAKEKRTRAQKVRQIEARGARMDLHMESKTMRERIHASLMGRRYKNYHMREEGLDLKYRKIYSKIKNGAFGPSDLVCWTDVVSRGMVKNVCKIMEFLLQNGPMTKIETDILDNCTELLKSYYSERVNLMQRRTPDVYHYFSTTYYPETSTSVHDLLIGSEEISCKTTILEILNKK